MFDILRRVCFPSNINFPISSFKANCHQVVKILSSLMGIVSKHQPFPNFIYYGRENQGMILKSKEKVLAHCRMLSVTFTEWMLVVILIIGVIITIIIIGNAVMATVSMYHVVSVPTMIDLTSHTTRLLWEAPHPAALQLFAWLQTELVCSLRTF